MRRNHWQRCFVRSSLHHVWQTTERQRNVETRYGGRHHEKLPRNSRDPWPSLNVGRSGIQSRGDRPTDVAQPRGG